MHVFIRACYMLTRGSYGASYMLAWKQQRWKTPHISPNYPSFLPVMFYSTSPSCIVSHTLSLSCSHFFPLLSLFFECRLWVGGEQGRQSRAALTCDLADPFLFKPRVQFHRNTKQIAQTSQYASIINANTWPVLMDITGWRRNPRDSLHVLIVLLASYLFCFSSWPC